MILFEREDIENLLNLLADRLTQAGIRGTISIVGGAALSLEYLPDRDATTDIDADFPQNDLVRSIIGDIAAAKNLEPNWINNAVTAYIPFETSMMWREILTVGSITIRVGSAELLLAMKLKADRGSRDRGDIEGLIKLLRIKSVKQVVEIYEKFHHQEVLSKQTLQVVEKILAES